MESRPSTKILYTLSLGSYMLVAKICKYNYIIIQPFGLYC